jgi:hypothetical protein
VIVQAASHVLAGPRRLRQGDGRRAAFQEAGLPVSLSAVVLRSTVHALP